MEFQGKKALVFGGTSGIGRAAVTKLRDAGADVVAISRDPSKAQDMDGVTLRGCDVRDREGLAELFASEAPFDILAQRYTQRNPEAREQHIQAERQRFLRAPVVVAVIARIRGGIKIPEWEQQLSVGAACQNILVAANLLGYAAQWLTEWYAFDEVVDAALGLQAHERVGGFIYLGSANEKPPERVRPELAELLSDWHLP